VKNNMKIIDIRFGEHSISLLIFLGFDDVKLIFPVSDQRGVYIKHLGNFRYGMI